MLLATEVLCSILYNDYLNLNILCRFRFEIISNYDILRDEIAS